MSPLSPPGEGPGERVGNVTTNKPPLPTRTLEQSRKLRREMTDAELKLWFHLRAGRFGGLKFRRQHSIPPYIADFCCVEKRLIIELDGSQHNEAGDRSRTQRLQRQGWLVLRFWNHDVLIRTESVLEAIWTAIGDQALDRPTLSPTPLPEGEGL